MEHHHGHAPVSKSIIDARPCTLSEHGYHVKLGYQTLVKKETNSPPMKLWEATWHRDSLLKVIFFHWKLSHNKILPLKMFRIEAYQVPLGVPSARI